MNDENFQSIIKNAENHYVEIAKEFEVALSTVNRWGNGIAKPHLRMQWLIIAYIEKLNTILKS